MGKKKGSRQMSATFVVCRVIFQTLAETEQIAKD